MTSDMLWEYRTELVAVEFPCVVFTFPPNLFCRGVSSFVTCGRDVWAPAPVYCSIFGKYFLNHMVHKYDGGGEYHIFYYVDKYYIYA